MINIVPIVDRLIGSKLIETVSARDLYAALNVDTDFLTWFQDQIGRVHMVEDKDYVLSVHDQVDYFMTLFAAKMIAGKNQLDCAEHRLQIVREYVDAIKAKVAIEKKEREIILALVEATKEIECSVVFPRHELVRESNQLN